MHLINCLFDLPPHRSSILQDLVTRNPHDLIPLLGQILVAVLIMLAAFGGLMMLTVDFDDQVQRDATEIDGVGKDRVFTTKLLISTITISQHLPGGLGKLVRGGSLMTSKLNRVMFTLQSSVHLTPAIGLCRLFAPSSPALLPQQ